MKLLIIRHGIAMERSDFRAISPDDAERPLTPEGTKKMRKNAQGLYKIVRKIDLLASSPLVRAEQTAQLVSVAYGGVPVEKCDAMKPERQPSELLHWLKSRFKGQLSEMDESVVAVVGHEPHLSHLLGYLLTGKSTSLIELRKGGACLISFEGGLVAGRGELLWLMRPSILRQIAK